MKRDEDLERLKKQRDAAIMRTFPDQCHWNELTIEGKPVPSYLHGLIEYWFTDQGKAAMA